MSYKSRIGNIQIPQVTFEWEIYHFLSLLNYEESNDSPSFSFGDSQWLLSLYLKEHYVFLYLVKKTGPPKTIKFWLAIKVSGGVEKKIEAEREFSEFNRYYEYVLSTSELRNQKSILIPDGVLTVICCLSINSHIAVTDTPSMSTDCAASMEQRALNDVSRSRELKVIRSMKSILDEGKRSDFTLKLGQREWRVHKVILESRCEYFENMFRHDWVENTVGEVTFEDVEEGSLQAILDFIYTGSTENISAGNVCEIFATAHKFLLDDLRSQCLEWMMKNMCLEIVCKVLVIGDRYEEKELKERAVGYFIREGGEVMDSEEWKRLKKDHAPIVADFLEDAAKRQVKKRRIQ